MLSSDILYSLLRLLHIQVNIFLFAPWGQAAHFTPVDAHIVVVDDKVGAGYRCAVTGQQSEEEGA